MAEVNTFDCSIREVLEWMARGLRGVPKPHMDTVTLHDPATGHYRLMRIGWHDGKRECKTIAHVRVRDGRVYVEEDNTDAQIAERLVRAGLPRDRVVFGYYTPAELAPVREVA